MHDISGENASGSQGKAQQGHDELVQALTNLANVFQEGQVFPRNGAAGYVESALEAAESVLAKYAKGADHA